MLFESPHVRVTAEHGTATLWLGFPGEPANALDLPRLRELDAAICAVAAYPAVQVLLVRSAIPGGFCGGLRPEALASLTHPSDRAAFAWFGQQVFDRLARLDAVTLAFLDGPCLGVGLELALACDHRLCVARPTTHLGFPDRFTLFGGLARLRQLAGRRGNELVSSGRTLSGREARGLGIVDSACCERRAKIELQTFLDQLEARPLKPRPPAEPIGFAAERRAFAVRTPRAIEKVNSPRPVNPVPPFPDVVGLLGDDPDAAKLLADVALRGGEVVICGNRAAVFAGIAAAQSRGFVTPLEAEQARLRVRGSDTLHGFDRAGLVFVADGHNPFRLAAAVQPRAVVCVIRPAGASPVRVSLVPEIPLPFPRRLVRVGFCEDNRIALFPGHSTDPDTLAALAAWLRPFGLGATVFPVAARLLPRAA
jgi:enoyl-CoA hydratase/carnithine racemase